MQNSKTFRILIHVKESRHITTNNAHHSGHAAWSSPELTTIESIKSIAVDESRAESTKVESIDRVDRQLPWIDRLARLDRFRGLVADRKCITAHVRASAAWTGTRDGTCRCMYRPSPRRHSCIVHACSMYRPPPCTATQHATHCRHVIMTGLSR